MRFYIVVMLGFICALSGQSAYAKWIMQAGVSNERYLEIGPDIGLVTREVIKINTPKSVSLKQK